MAQTLIVTGLAALGAFLIRPKRETPVEDRKPTTLSAPGDMHIPLLLGIDRVSPRMFWAGDRISTVTGSSAKGAPQTPGTRYYGEGGAHALAIGVAGSLYRVWRNGTVIFNRTITRQNHNSGDAIALPGRGTFRFYWGEPDQPVDTYLAGRMGVASRWPLACYAVWQRCNFGTQASWPALDYEIGVPPCAPLEDSNGWISDGADEPTYGANPAHALYQILNTPYPRGVGIPAANLDAEAFEAFGVLCAAEGLPITINASDGSAAYNAVGKILEEIGVALVQYGDKLTVIPARAPSSTPPTITTRAILSDAPPIERVYWPRIGERVTYVYPDRSRNYRNGPPIQFDDDTGIADTGQINIIERELVYPRSPTVANRIAARLHITDLNAPTEIELEVARGARLLSPGQVADTPYGRVRVASILRRWDGTALMTVAIDPFSLPGIDIEPTFPPPPDAPLPSNIPDTQTIPVELPAGLSSDQFAFTVARVRATATTLGGTIFYSPDRSDFVTVASQPEPAAGGTLLDSVTPESAWIDGIRFRSNTTDPENYAGTLSDSFWQGGERLLVLFRRGSNLIAPRTEICLCRHIDKLDDGEYIARGVLRGVFDQQPLEFAVGDQIAIVNRSNQAIFTHPLADSIGEDAYFKSAPDGIDVGQTDTIRTILTGRATLPLPVENLRASSPTSEDDGAYRTPGDPAGQGLNQYAAGETITLEWDYRVAGFAPDAAGSTNWNTAHSADTESSDGSFEIDIIDSSGTVVATRTASADADSLTYSSAQRNTDLGETDPVRFSAAVYQIISGTRSLGRMITIRRQ